MIGNWNMFEPKDSRRYFDFANAYLSASEDVCKRISRDIREKIGKMLV